MSGSHLLLKDGDLTAIDLTHAELPEAELAFLSACTTARAGYTVPDEPLHLAGACQLAGYRHVVGSLWPISDTDTVWLAETFYRATLSAPDNGAATAAEALHEATRQLRAINRDHPHLWAGYTHTGP